MTKITMKTKKTPTIFHHEKCFIMDVFSSKRKKCCNKNKKLNDCSTEVTEEK
jgi:hypothetical protein